MPPPQDNARFFLLIVLLFWLFSSPDNAPGLISAPAATTARLARQRHAHGVLNTTKWGDFAPRLADDPDGTASRHLNLTGFRQNDGYAWSDLGRFRDRCKEWSENASPTLSNGEKGEDSGISQPTWQNVTGVVNGGWIRRIGGVQRQAASYNLSDISPAVGWLGMHSDWMRNITGSHGTVLMRLKDKNNSIEYQERIEEGTVRAGGLVREVSADFTVQDVDSSSSSWDMRLHGVHWPKKGVVLLTTTSEKYAGIFGLPHLTPGPEFFRSSQALLNETLDSVLRKKEKTRFSDPSNPWSSSVEGPENWSPSPHCEYVVYIQIHPLSSYQLRVNYLGDNTQERLGSLVQEIEDELRYPTGAPVRRVPELQMSLVAWSPDCSYYLESKGPPIFPSVEGQHLLGMKEEIIIYEAKYWLLIFALILYGQVFLLKAQMKESSTPSTIGRVSFYTASIMLMADALIFVTSLTWYLSASSAFLPALAVGFTAFMSVTCGGVFLSDVFKIQEPERRPRNRDQAENAAGQPRPLSTTTPPPPLADSLPRPATAPPPRPPSPPIIIPSDQDIDAEIAENTAAGATPVPSTGTTTNANAAAIAQQIRATTFTSITGRFIVMGTSILFLSLAATSWPTKIRAAYANLLAFTYLSLWIPQIARNIQRNSRRAFAWRFMIGQSIFRLAPLAYFYLRKDNILFAQPDRLSFACLALWLWIQLWILAFQDILGPRFGIPASWTPEAWDYHPILREDGVEAGGLPIGLLAGTSAPSSPTLERARTLEKERERQGTIMRTIDCAICRETLEVQVVRAGHEDPTAGGVAGVLARRSYMVTPCRHIFHSACLEGWLRFRLQCPICREELPPL
ncbi:hypothetical protein GQ53DRAFT_649395 [Thozetella sp. PMI_491]|nr:hypothetical protein GQ53DRAFT_649395 [Thozetella sp. PMI_491]